MLVFVLSSTLAHAGGQHITAAVADDGFAVESGPGGRQIQIEDPDGNGIELHELVAR